MKHEIKDYINIFNKFENKKEFTELFNQLALLELRDAQSVNKIEKLNKILIALVFIGGMSCLISKKIDMLFMLVASSMVCYMLPIVFFLNQSKKEKSKFKNYFAQKVNDNPHWLKDIAKLSVDKDGDFFLQEIINNVMHSKTEYTFERFIGLLDNYLLHQEVLERNLVNDAFLAQVGGVNPFLVDKNMKKTEEKYLEAL